MAGDGHDARLIAMDSDVPTEDKNMQVDDPVSMASSIHHRSLTVGQKTAPMFECFGKVGMV